MELLNKNYLITGAASGLGRDLSIALSYLGANLTLLDINFDELSKTVKRCNAAVHIETITADLSDIENIYNILTASCKGVKLNGFVHCAGIPCISPIQTISYSDCLRVMQVNAFSALEIIKWFSRKNNHVSSQKSPASVVLISSVYGLVGSAGNTAYAMSKGAIQSMTKSLSIELARKHIRVNCICPGFMRTEMDNNTKQYFDASREQLLESLHPLGLGIAKNVSDTICFLLSDCSSWTTGSILCVDGGFTAQ